jgi:hypothetical protein
MVPCAGEDDRERALAAEGLFFRIASDSMMSFSRESMENADIGG